MTYTWEDVMLGIDVRNEQADKRQQQKDIEEKMADESTAAGWWKLGLSLVGHALFGPIGAFVGKQIAEYGVDKHYDWESMEMEEGKFDVSRAKEFNKDLKRAAKDQDQGQILNTMMDIGQMYIQAGGLTAKPGELDFTTYGSGEGEWSIFGKDRPDKLVFDTGGIPGLEDAPRGPSTVIPGKSVPSLWEADKDISSLLSTYNQGGTMAALGTEINKAIKSTK